MKSETTTQPSRLKHIKTARKTLLAPLILSLVLSSCATISFFDQYAYTQATSIKVDLMNLAEQSATTNYDDAKTEIDRVVTEVQKAKEYSLGRKLNTISTSQYEILLKEDGFFQTFLKT